MVDLKISKFRENCAYCWKGLEDQLVVCICGISLCDEHQKIHLYRSKHSVMYHIGNRTGLCVYSPVLSEEECLRVKIGVTNLLSSENRTESLLFESSKLDCPHILELEPQENTQDRQKEKCCECDVKSNLWMCFTCGYAGCGRRQYGVEGNSHSLEHSSSSGHPVVIFMGSMGDSGNNDTFCYKCDGFVINNRAKGSNSRIDGRPRSFFDIQEKALNDTSAEESTSESKSSQNEGGEINEHVGIHNLGNTCYISSVMQMIASVVETEYLDEHFVQCGMPPLECLICQTIRVLLSLRAKASVPAIDFVRLVFKNFPVFERNVQQDASEFFIYFLNHIKLAEAEGKINRITRTMDYELNTIIECECGLVNRLKEDSFFLNVPFAPKVSSALNKAFEGSAYDCKCGKVGKRTSYFRVLPEYLFVVVNRCTIDKAKIKEDIETDEIVVQNFLETVPNAESTKELAQLGYGREDINNALIRSDNDTERACNILLNNENFPRRMQRSYKIHSAVCHKGDSIGSGHYTCIVNEGSRLIHIDDSSVRVGSEETLKSAYIICYH